VATGIAVAFIPVSATAPPIRIDSFAAIPSKKLFFTLMVLSKTEDSK